MLRSLRGYAQVEHLDQRFVRYIVIRLSKAFPGHKQRKEHGTKTLKLSTPMVRLGTVLQMTPARY